jgi:diguanylate cyclase
MGQWMNDKPVSSQKTELTVARPRPVNILLAEDNPGDARLVHEMLSASATRAYQITQVTRLSELAEALELSQFDILLLDLSLPDSGCPTLDGLLGVQALSPALPIVILTGLDDEQFALCSMQRGIQDYLVKGHCTDAQLWAAIQHGIERKRAELRLARMAMYDVLTGIANRALFFDRLEQAINRVQRGTLDGFALMELDIDRFKALNDTFGHPTGDNVLKTVGERLEHCMRRSDTVGRLGGDEFGMLVEGVTSESGASITMTKCLTALDSPFALNGQEFKVAVSIGVARCPVDGTTAAQLMAYADAAMYRSKRVTQDTAQVMTQELRLKATGTG